MLPVRKIENYVKDETKNIESVVHDFPHLKRTAIGSKWFVKISNGSKHDENLAYIAGLLHDIVRPASEKIDHAKASAEKSQKILEKFKFGEGDKKRIVEAIESHREKQEWKDALHQSVFLADKILEQMGAVIIFRRSMYVGECEDYANKEPLKSIMEQFRKKLKKFTILEFPKKFRKLIRYQYKWSFNFLQALENNEKWAIEIALFGYSAGIKKENIEQTIKKFRPRLIKQKNIYRETILYLKNKKFSEFEKLIKL